MHIVSVTDHWQSEGKEHWQTGILASTTAQEREHDVWTAISPQGLWPQQFFDLQVYAEGTKGVMLYFLHLAPSLY